VFCLVYVSLYLMWVILTVLLINENFGIVTKSINHHEDYKKKQNWKIVSKLAVLSQFVKGLWDLIVVILLNFYVRRITTLVSESAKKVPKSRLSDKQYQ